MEKINRKGSFSTKVCILLVAFLTTISIQAQNKETNIALAKWGTTALASSAASSSYAPEKAIDGLWVSTDAGIGRKYVWNSAYDQNENWLSLDFGQKRTIHRIMIRHEGVYELGERYNTSDFTLQHAKSLDGPWSDLLDPIISNHSDVSVHDFAPVETRYVRLWIDKAEQNSNSYARIHEMEVYSNLKNKEVLVSMEVGPEDLRKLGGVEEVKLNLELFPAESLSSFESLRIVSDDFKAEIGTKDLSASQKGNECHTAAWMPISLIDDELRIEGIENGKSFLLRKIPSIASKVHRWGYFSGGEVNIICSSHNDIAWMDTPAKTAEFRERDCIGPALERMKNRDDVYFSMENVLYLDEYLERQPQKQKELFQLSAGGYFDWGATYNQPYESLLSGEQLIRELYLGAKKVRKMIPGITARVAYNVDVPGRTRQMPQILSKANVPYLVLSRHERGLFNWESPDGSSILCWSMDHYYDLHELGYVSHTEDFIKLIGEKAKLWEPLYMDHKIPSVNGVLFSEDYIGPADFDKYIDETHDIRKKLRDNGLTTDSPYFPPAFKYASAEQFFDKIARSDAQLKTIKGERPNVWLYIHGPAHHKAISSKRAAGVILPAAESFSTINSVLEGSFTDYPQDKLNKAWAASIYDDHGWGGNNGHITDEVFKEKLDFAKEQGQEMLNDALSSLTEKINTSSQKGEAIALFNALSWMRTDPVTVKVKAKNRNFGIVDHAGKELVHQIIKEEEDGYYQVVFIAEDIPSLGYKTYYVSKKAKHHKAKTERATSSYYENEFYSLKFGKGGLTQILDKQLGKELINANKFQAGEIFTMQSVGNGAGEFWDVQKLEMEGFDKVSLHNPVWELVANGPVFALYELEQPLKNCTVKEQIMVYHELKRIDCKVSLLAWDGTKSREFRLALPLNMDHSKITYEVPMGTVTIGEDEIEGPAGWNYWPECKNTHPREVQNFISTNNGELGVTLSSSVAVFDHIDPTDDPASHPLIQPVLLASRRSCHGKGNWYLQEGDHHYSFSIFSHEAGWENGYKQAIQANNPILPVSCENKRAELPAELSFFSVSKPNTLVSTVKKCEDDSQVIVRLFDIEGEDSHVELKPFFPISEAEHTNIIEEEGKSIQTSGASIHADVGRYAIETFKIVPEKSNSHRSLKP